MNREFKDAIENSPIIAAIKNDAELHQCLTCDSRVIFILYGDICNIAGICGRLANSGGSCASSALMASKSSIGSRPSLPDTPTT